uniref:Uncharacterized protein n=1 Tax=Anopheles maculatus TaxID=74869 RepID=A0A182SL20_9DIPT
MLATTSSASGAANGSGYYHGCDSSPSAVVDQSELHYDASQTTTTMIGPATLTSKTGVRVKSEHVPDSSNSRSSDILPPSAISADSGVFVWGDGAIDGDDHQHHLHHHNHHVGGGVGGGGGGGVGSGVEGIATSSAAASSSSSMLSGGVLSHLNNNNHINGGKVTPDEITNKNASLSDTKLSPNLFQYDFAMSALKPPSAKSSPENMHQRYGFSDFDADGELHRARTWHCDLCGISRRCSNHITV